MNRMVYNIKNTFFGWKFIPSCGAEKGDAWYSSLKEVWHEIFDFRFLHKSVSPGPLSIQLGSFRIFSKIRGDNREWMFVSGVNDTGEKR